MIKYNIIIPIIYRDYQFLEKSIEYIFKYINPQVIFIITNRRFKRFLPKNIKKCTRCVILSEDEIIDGLNYDMVVDFFKNKQRYHTKPGWYFQQLLKMGFCLNSNCNTTYYLSWDADTIPLRNLDFFDADYHPYFTMKIEHHAPYFNAIKRLLNLEKTNKRSYIAENMMFNKNIMAELIEKINKNTIINGETWFEKILNSLDDETISTFGFSEFETYGSYCFNNYPGLYKERVLSSLRYAGLIQGRFISKRILNLLSFDLSLASFEVYHIPPFPWNVINKVYNIYLQNTEWILNKLY